MQCIHAHAVYSYSLCLTERGYVKMNLRTCLAVAFYDESKILITNYKIVLMKNHDAFIAIWGTNTRKY